MTKRVSKLARREFLKVSAAAGAVGALGTTGMLNQVLAAGNTVNFMAWSAAVDLVKSHVAEFEKSMGIGVEYANAPWANYRDNIITKFVGNAPIDMMWVSDAWLPEFADAGWIAPINKFDNLMKYNDDAEDFCNDSMTYKGQQYGLTYYTDFMAFLYDEQALKKAGIDNPPRTWDQVTEQCLKIKAAGISEYPLMLALANESWLMNFLAAMVYSHGGRFTDEKGNSAMQSPTEGAVKALQWVMDAVHKHKIVSPACVETGELTGLKAFQSGNHAFALEPKYRMRPINDPAQSQIAGRCKQALMPRGDSGDHNTVGWMRFHGMSAATAADSKQAELTAKLIEWFGGKANGEYKFQKYLFTDIGAGFGVKSLFNDKDVQASYNSYADVDMIKLQQSMALKSDVVTPWYGEWQETHATAWQAAIVGQTSAEEAMKKAGDAWNSLKKEFS